MAGTGESGGDGIVRVKTGKPIGAQRITLTMTLKELAKLQWRAQRKGQTVDDFVRDLVRRMVR